MPQRSELGDWLQAALGYSCEVQQALATGGMATVFLARESGHSASDSHARGDRASGARASRSELHPGGERVDARDLKSLGRKAVPVRVRPRVLALPQRISATAVEG